MKHFERIKAMLCLIMDNDEVSYDEKTNEFVFEFDVNDIIDEMESWDHDQDAWSEDEDKHFKDLLDGFLDKTTALIEFYGAGKYKFEEKDTYFRVDRCPASWEDPGYFNLDAEGTVEIRISVESDRGEALAGLASSIFEIYNNKDYNKSTTNSLAVHMVKEHDVDIKDLQLSTTVEEYNEIMPKEHMKLYKFEFDILKKTFDKEVK